MRQHDLAQLNVGRLKAATDSPIEPADAARLLRALTLSATHPMLAAEPRCAADIVDLFLNGASS